MCLFKTALSLSEKIIHLLQVLSEFFLALSIFFIVSIPESPKTTIYCTHHKINRWLSGRCGVLHQRCALKVYAKEVSINHWIQFSVSKNLFVLILQKLC